MSAHEISTTNKRGTFSTGHMTHSLSTLSGVDGTTLTPRHGGGKKLAVRIQMLDDSITLFQVQAKAIGKLLFEQVCRQLNLLEADYFGLEYQEQTTRTKYWLDLLKPLNRQVGLSLVEPLLRFCIKFYTPDPSQLEEEYTRYLFCLQIKRDLATGSLQCNDNTAALMASYIVQASCGDFVPEDYPDHTYLSSHRFVPHQDTIMQRKIMENHKKHTGQSPAEADLNLLETARRCELYGMKMHSAKDIEGVPLNLSVAHMGVSVFQGITRINIFSWAKIRKISFKRKRFLIKLHPEGYGYYKDTVEFFFDGRNECKNFWKKCVENHGFFRCVAVTNPPRRKTKVLSRGSSFRYSGKTQKQIIEFVRENYVKRQNFQRSQSFRQGPLNASSRSQSHTYVNSSISANPLLPINTADWDSHNHCSTSTMQFLTKKSTDTWGHPKDNLTEHSHSQVTAAQVEIYQTRNYVLESPILEVSHIPRSAVDQMDQMNMQRSVSPLAPQPWNSPKHSKVGTKDQDQAHVLLGKYNLGQSLSSHLYNNNSPQRVSMGSQACVTAPPQQTPITTSINNFNQSRIISADLNNSTEFAQEKEEAALSEIEKNSNLTTSTSSQGNIVPLQERSQHFIPALYSSMNYLTSKQSSINNNTSIETDTDNIIYTDINNIYYSKYPNEYTCEVEHKISNENNLNIINGGDIYATVNRKTKLKSKVNHISDEFFDQSIEKNLLSKRNSLNNSLTQTYLNPMSNNCYTDNIYNKQYTFDSSEAKESLESYVNKANPKLSEFKNITRSELSIGPIELQTQTNHYTLPLPKKSDLSCEHSMDSYDSHYKAYELYDALQTRNDVNYLMYGNDPKLPKTTNGRLSTHSNPPRLSSDKLEHEPSNIHFYSAAQFKQQEDKDSWLKSSSCKDLLIESEKCKPFSNFAKGFLSYNRIESPVTRYDDSHHSMYVNKNQYNSTYQDFSSIIDSKIYSSSYPGSTRNNFGYHKRVYENQFLDYTGSQDDISHDSYELLEKYNPELIDKHTRSDHNIRSCSIDSGNFIPSDDEIASGNQKYRSAMDIKSKSAADIMNEIWDSEDPRYFPRENLSVKSDGSFYKKVREVQDSQSSSQESQSDLYETKASRNSWCSKKSRDSLYHTDSKKSRESSKSKTSVVSSGGSKESLTEDFLSRNYEMPMTTGKKVKKNSKNNQYQQHSSVESKSDYYDAQDFMENDWLNRQPKVKSITCLLSDKQDSMLNRFQCEYRDTYSTFPSNKNPKTSKVHSISLQNVEIKKNVTSLSTNSPENLYKYQEEKEARNSISVNGENLKKNLDKECQTSVPFRRKSDSENIFSFDRDKIESLTSGSTQDEKTDEGNTKNSPDYPLTPELISEFDKQPQHSKAKTVTRKEELIAKTHFEEYNPKVINNQPVQLPNVLLPLTYIHATVERTKSDPNSLANRSGLCKNQRRHVLMHQKSIDLTPADSSDEDYYYRQIPSAPPQCKTFGNFEIPKACDSQVAPIDITKTGFETPKSFFHEFEYRASKVLKEEIPYVLHKRHVVNGTNLSPIEKKHQRPKSPKTPKSPKSQISSNTTKKVKSSIKMLPDILDNVVPEPREGFLFTQNVDLSKINPISLEFNNSLSKIEHSSPKCELNEQLDIRLLEKLNMKLSKIENDSGANSKTENNHFKEQLNHILEHKPSELTQTSKKEIILPTRMAMAKRTISKTRLTNKIKRSKTRITSFSSDDESLDSDDVFGSTEPMPSALEFSPPQSRKEIEPILRIEQSKLISAAWGRGQTMSSTEIEGSPPQCRRLTDLESHYDPLKLNSPYHNATELRRISERSISIPSSEEEMYASAKVICVSTGDCQQNENIPFPILMPFIPDEADKKILSTMHTTNKATESINYTLKKNDCKNVSISEKTFTSNNSKENVSIMYSQVRLNLSEGSGLACLQKQKSDLESTDRRAKSLDTPFISMHKLPPINAFSSKDDTIEFEEEVEILEEKALHNEMSNIEEETHYSVRSCAGSIPSAQVCHSTFRHDPILSTVNIDFEENDLLHQLKFIEKISLKGVKIKDREKSKMELRSGEHLILDIPKYNFDYSPLNSCNSSRKTSPGVSRASSLESTGMRKSKTRSKSSDAMKLKLSIGNVSSIKKDKKNILKENFKSVESERRLSKEKNKSNEETEADIAKRKERQQKLYESAMKQTVTMLSPVGDQLPPFPAPEDKISVKTEGDKIIIETEFKSRAKDHVLITKAPRKLDTSLVKFSRSFDEGGCQKKLEKANRSFEDRKKSFEDSEKSEPTSDFAIESPKTTIKNRQFDGKDANNRDVKPSYLDKKLIGDDKNKNYASKSLSSEREFKSEDSSEKLRTAVGDRKIFANHFYFNEEIDMQAVISERRSLEILNRHSPRSDEMARDSDGSHIPSTGESIDSCVSIDESTSDSKPLFTAEGYPQRVPTIECEEPSIDGDENNTSECHQSKKSRFSAYHLSLDRSRSDETGSWITVECDEYIGSDLSENDPRTLEPDTDALEKQTPLDDERELNTTVLSDNLSKCAQNINVILPNTNLSSKKPIDKQKANSEFEAKQKGTFSQQSDKSKSSDSWTSGEGNAGSPKLRNERYDWSLSFSGKEKSSIDDESSVSCSIARPLGISQDFGDVETKKCLELKQQMLKLDLDSTSRQNIVSDEVSNTVAIRRTSTPVLEKQSPVDFGTSTEVLEYDIGENTQDLVKDDSNLSPNSSVKIPYICKPVRKTTSKNTSLTAIGPVAKIGKSESNQSSQESKSSFDSKASLSVESKGSFETESSSGSLGLAQRRGELLQKEQQSTWKSFPIENSSNSSVEEPHINIDLESIAQIDNLNAIRDFSESDFIELSLQTQSNDEQCQDELIDFPTTFGYPVMTSALSGIGINPTDIIGYSTGFATGRTLSRISERSTASEKSSIEDDVSKASTQSVSVRDESACSTDHQPSLSSDSRSNTNMAYISDADRRTSAEMPDIPCDSATGERLSSISSINEPKSTTVITGRFAVTQVDEQNHEEFDKHTLLCLSNPGSQDSEDWPLPEIPYDSVPVKPTELIFSVPNLDKRVPKTFCWKPSMPLQFQDSQSWLSPTSDGGEVPFGESFKLYKTFEKQRGPEAMVGFTKEDANNIPQCSKFESSPSSKKAKVLPYADTSYFMSSPFDLKNEKHDTTCFETEGKNSPTCLNSVSFLPYSFNYNCCSASKSVPDSFLLTENISEGIVILQPTRSPIHSPTSAEDVISNDDVFFPGTTKVQQFSDESHESEPDPKPTLRSYNSDTSVDDVASTSGITYKEDEMNVLRSFDKRLRTGSCRKCSHSSYSEDETISNDTDLDGTVRMGLQQKKCTHSSHSEDTSIGLSISEWSTGTNNVHQYANLSGSDSLSAVSNHSLGVKSEKSNQTKSRRSSFNKSSESLNGKSANFSGSKKLSGDNGLSDNLKYDILSNSETDKCSDSLTKSDDTTLTLTEIAQIGTEWSTSSSRTLISSKPQVPPTNEIKNRVGSFVEYIPLKNPRNVKNASPPSDNNVSFPLIHKKKNSTTLDSDNQRTQHVPPSCIVDMKEKCNPFSRPSKQKNSFEMMPKSFKNQKSISDEEAFTEYLYPSNEKFSARYQSQEFVPLQKSIVESVANLEMSSLPEKKIQHHNSNEDRNFPSPIKEFEANTLQDSHEHISSTVKLCPKTRENTLNKGSRTIMTTTTSMGYTEPTTSKNISSPYTSGDDKSLRNSLFNPRNLSSETHSTQMTEKLLRSGSMARSNYINTPTSGNDTDSSLDLRNQELEIRCRGFRKKRPMPKKRMRSERLRLEQGVIEWSKDYPSDNEAPKLSCDDNRKIDDEELSSDAYHPYEDFFCSNVGSDDMSSNNEDAIESPPYDQLTDQIYPQSSSFNQYMPTAEKQHIKPARQKKRQLNREESIITNKFSFEQETTMSDEFQHEENDLPFPYSLSYYGNEELDIEQDKCGLDIRIDPPQNFSNETD